MNCPDCKGTGKYVGFTVIEDCRTCGGKGIYRPPVRAERVGPAPTPLTRGLWSWEYNPALGTMTPTLPLACDTAGTTVLRVEAPGGVVVRLAVFSSTVAHFRDFVEKLDDCVQHAMQVTGLTVARVIWVGRCGNEYEFRVESPLP